MTAFKPSGYNSVSPYLVVNGAEKMLNLLERIFAVKRLRRYDGPDGLIVHAEIKVDDSVVMVADATSAWPQNQSLIHVYVSDVDAVIRKAVEAGCNGVDEPKEREGDPDRRGGFRDFAGNYWSVSTQKG
jgi:uncharacterized glyoxalase superfamily protein PhnB